MGIIELAVCILVLAGVAGLAIWARSHPAKEDQLEREWMDSIK